LVSQLSEMGKIGCAPNPTANRKRVSAASWSWTCFVEEIMYQKFQSERSPT
jgi:hypothetical protein